MNTLHTHSKVTDVVEFMCRYCRKLCFSNEELVVHEKTHLDNKKLMCRLCGKGFARRSYLSEHMLVHAGVCPWKCDKCPKTFALRCNLVRHTRVHTDEKLFKCELCSKRFTLKKNRQEHRLTHTNEKPFCCPQCARKFARRSSLVRHARTHTDSRTFECAHCGKKFPWRYYLQRHLLNKHEDPPKTKLPPKKRMRRTKAQIARDKAVKEAEQRGNFKEFSTLVPFEASHQIKIEEGEDGGTTTRVFVSTPVVDDKNYEFEGPEGIIKEEKSLRPVEENDQAEDLPNCGRENLANENEGEDEGATTHVFVLTPAISDDYEYNFENLESNEDEKLLELAPIRRRENQGPLTNKKESEYSEVIPFTKEVIELDEETSVKGEVTSMEGQ